MIKTADKKAPAVPLDPCYEEDTQPCLGITFCPTDSMQRYAPYAFLSTVDFDGRGEMIFRFTSWTATVRGENLQALWKAVREGCLTLVRERNRTSSTEEPWVREIAFSEADSDADLRVTGPAYP
jgi:hypothetical protein